jgi:fatty-acyl-CoA synthase
VTTMSHTHPQEAVDYPAMTAGRLPDVGFFDSRGMTGEMSGDALLQDACALAAGLAHHGVRHQDRVLLLLPTGRNYITTLLACLISGVPPCTTAAPTKPSDPSSAGVRHLEAAVAAVRPRAVVVADATLAGAVPADVPVVIIDDLAGHGSVDAAALPIAAPETVHHIQLTSGSTSAPKAVVLTHANVAANLFALRRATDLRPGRDRMLTWLPLYHDMGLMQVLLALTAGIGLDLMASFGFVRDPLAWLRHMSQRGSTITAAPPFAYQSVADRFQARPEPGIDLSKVRHFFIGAEPIPVPVLLHFRDTFTGSGLAAAALLPSYGMAETVVATSLSSDERPTTSNSFGRVRFQYFDRAALQVRQVAQPAIEGRPSLGIVSCGRPVEGLHIRVVDDSGRPVKPGSIGAVHVRGSSVMAGYLGVGGPQAPPEGWHDTGDLGLIHDGDIYIVGRTKEMLIIRGRNLPPYDVEAVIEQHPQIGASVVFSYPLDSKSTEPVVAVVESAVSGDDGARLGTDVSTAVRAAFGLSLAEVVVVPRGRIPRTSSGKRQRARVRSEYLSTTSVEGCR